MIYVKDSFGDIGWEPYMRMPDGKTGMNDILEESMAIRNFIECVTSSETVAEFQGKEKTYQFINYGSTQLVFVLTIDSTRQYTLLVNQPSAPDNIGRTEFDNLKMLSKADKEHVIIPLYYFNDLYNNKRELYVTPYFEQSRCIGVDETEWGMWVPEPKYHFRDFTSLERNIINVSMVALLVKLYDEKQQKGLSGVRLDGGDFMLEKGFEDHDIDFNNILKKMKLIAARSLVQMDLDKYIERIRLELSGEETDKQHLRIIGQTLRKPLTLDEIDAGIELGMGLREQSKQQNIAL